MKSKRWKIRFSFHRASGHTHIHMHIHIHWSLSETCTHSSIVASLCCHDGNFCFHHLAITCTDSAGAVVTRQPYLRVSLQGLLCPVIGNRNIPWVLDWNPRTAGYDHNSQLWLHKVCWCRRSRAEINKPRGRNVTSASCLQPLNVFDTFREVTAPLNCLGYREIHSREV